MIDEEFITKGLPEGPTKKVASISRGIIDDSRQWDTRISPQCWRRSRSP